MKLSIIIPVFNVEQYIEKCLISCMCQNLRQDEYEIIVINDGSTDKSPEIVKSMARQCNIIRFYEQDNHGLSYTRNRGLKLAKGDVVWFVDSDDWLEYNCVSSMLSIMQGADVLICTRMFPEGMWNSDPYFIPDSVSDIKGWFYCKSPSPVQFYLFRRNFLLSKNLLFEEGRKHEDALFTPIALLEAKSMKFYRNPVYHFYKHGGSISTTVDKKRVLDYKYVVGKLYEYYKHNCPNNLKDGFANRIANSIVAHLQVSVLYGRSIYDDTNDFYYDNPKLLSLLNKSTKRYTRMLYFFLKSSPFSIRNTYNFLSCIRYLRIS